MTRTLMQGGLALGLATGTALGAAFQWTVGSGGNDHWYEPVSFGTGISWSDAQSAATLAGGYLATVTSAAENSFVFSLVDQAAYWHADAFYNSSVGPWLGGSQPNGSPEPGDGWTWLNGDGGFTFTAWAVGQPDNFGAGEDKLHYLVPGSMSLRAATWNDVVDVQYPQSYVIEYNFAPVPEVESMAVVAGLALSAFGLLRRLRR
jgi:hypothetical protein